MKVISQNRDMIVSFHSGLWILQDRSIKLMTNHGVHSALFATYVTQKQAKRTFELFINHACNTNVFDFSENHFDR